MNMTDGCAGIRSGADSWCEMNVSMALMALMASARHGKTLQRMSTSKERVLVSNSGNDVVVVVVDDDHDVVDDERSPWSLRKCPQGNVIHGLHFASMPSLVGIIVGTYDALLLRYFGTSIS